MTDNIVVDADARTRSAISELHGAAQVLGALRDDKGAKYSLPGFALALALVEKEVADMRAQMAGAVYRCAAKAGHDVSILTSIYTSVNKDGVPTIELKPADLVERAEND